MKAHGGGTAFHGAVPVGLAGFGAGGEEGKGKDEQTKAHTKNLIECSEFGVDGVNGAVTHKVLLLARGFGGRVLSEMTH